MQQSISNEKRLSKRRKDGIKIFEYKFRKEPIMDLEDVIKVLVTTLKKNITFSECPESTSVINGSSLPMNNFATNINNPEEIIRAHIDRSRLLLPGEMHILLKCPALINDMLDVVSEISMNLASSISLSWHKKGEVLEEMPRLTTVENCMKLSQMITQALDSTASPVQQLPHNGMGYLGRDKVPLKIPVPPKAGSHLYSIVLCSDSYFNVDKRKHVQLNVDANGSTIVDVNALDNSNSSSDEGYSEEQSIADCQAI
ncbi:hypothetical protein DPMN_109303 [Dreissena polymorpha]|uniref:Uncharacterized protein n=1 Tax=Dreissena polymorpha TaxID=45954 RepID=A0A9D4QM12_DREPO|nr:hypothetical protein DPMN_109303 [Dreissena polymorpha]